MTSVRVAELKSKLSHYLAAVKDGKEFLITSNRHSIARWVLVEKSTSELELIPATQPIASLQKVKGLELGFDPVAVLLEDRQRR